MTNWKAQQLADDAAHKARMARARGDDAAVKYLSQAVKSLADAVSELARHQN